MVYVFGEILFWLLAALILGGVLAALWMRLVTGARGEEQLAPLRDRITSLETERDSLRRELGEAQDRSTERETQLSALKDDLEARNGKIASQAAEIERLREVAANPEPAGEFSESPLKAELVAARAQVAERDAEISELNATLENAREAYHHLEAAQFGTVPSSDAGVAPSGAQDQPTEQDEFAPGERSADAEETAPQDEGTRPEAHAGSAAGSAEPEERIDNSEPMTKPRTPDAAAGQRDDLTRIKGIGKVLETKLNALGVSSFAQIAALSPDDVARLGADLTPKGRIERDDWIGQAQALLAEREVH